MNKIYKIVFNRLTNASVVTSELAKGRGKTKNHIGKALLLTAICAGGIDTVEAAKVMGNGLRGDGTTISTGDVNVDHGIAIGTGDGADKARVVKDRAIAIGSNSTADGVMSIALGRKAQTEKDNSLAIGTNATTRYENSIAIGRDAYTNADSHNSYSTDGIAIGNGAKTSLFGDTSTRFKLVKFGRNKVAEGISIGTKSIARTGSVQIGNQDYNGAIGEYNLSDVNNKLQGVNNVGATTVGDNSINRSHFSAVIGAYNSLSSIKQIGGGFTALLNGTLAASNAQGMGSTILGSLNSMENLPSENGEVLQYSGIANSIVGTANKIRHSNGALIWGTGNEINRSILNMNEYLNVSGMNGNHSIKDLQNNLMTYSKTNRAGSVGVIGSDNEVNQTLFSTVFGVGNRIKTTEEVTEDDLASINNKSSEVEKLADNFRSKNMNAFLSVSGYENNLKDVTRGMIMGVKNITEYATDTLMFGNYHALKGTKDNLAERNILLGFNYDNVNPEHHADQPTKGQTDVATSVKDTIGIGSDVKLGADRTIAMGKGANAKGEDSIAIGTENLAGGTQTIAVGYKNVVTATHSGAFGDPNYIGTDKSNTTGTYAFGNNNGSADKPIITNHTFILGSNVVTTADNSVALGKDTAITAGSADTTASLKAKVTDGTDGTTTTAGSTGTVNKANVNGVEYSGFAGSTSIGAVSVGASGLERRVQNVAAGEISGTSTDAINGSQLYAIADTLSKKMLTGDAVNTTVNNALSNSGWKISEDNGTKTEKDLVKPNDNVVFAKGIGTTVSVETAQDGKETTVKYNVNVDGSTIKVNSEGKLYAVLPSTSSIEKSNITVKESGEVLQTESEGLVTAKNLSSQLSHVGFTLKAGKTEGTNSSSDTLANGEMMKTGSTVTMSAGKNMDVEHRKGGEVVYKTKDDVNFNSVQLGADGPKIQNNNGNGIKFSDKNGNNPVKVNGVAPGEISSTSTDAINGSQLHAVAAGIGHKLGDLDNKINNVGKRGDAGTASALAAATIPQAYTPGKSLVGIAAGSYQGQTGVAVGMSRISDNGKIIIRLSGTTNTQGRSGVAAGVGYQW
ncbi:YadA-like family protein [Haemophilus haemolyticus]|uniref:YadA-like family protein n=1 Tax=Haemophilus haemolyticus TaxID=726 RepID=UPI000E58A08E|nr:YadA-like family protein [Haemophilus haemolyticus]